MTSLYKCAGWIASHETLLIAPSLAGTPQFTVATAEQERHPPMMAQHSAVPILEGRHGVRLRRSQEKGPEFMREPGLPFILLLSWANWLKSLPERFAVSVAEGVGGIAVRHDLGQHARLALHGRHRTLDLNL
jgi:hypothetical protein